MGVSRLPKIYRAASWRCTLPVCPLTQRLGVGFDVPGEGVLRLSLSVDHATKLAASLAEYLAGNELRP